MRLGVFGHREYEGIPEIVAMLQREAPRLGIEISVENSLLEIAAGAPELTDPSTIDALVSLGGDGTLLRAARFLNGSDARIILDDFMPYQRKLQRKKRRYTGKNKKEAA